ncbi:CPCC family cysteine-rich protein [Amycolatopsis jiangsuensis]|uniref:CPCC family cysteine-rich protein n=1 Tax=Amycolatopsis jiangsuensis TaxID=1181879 RepID=UPI0016221211|nr:CPCC family cysteine-rich protein [Amycolatopsis jiangsuensis]
MSLEYPCPCCGHLVHHEPPGSSAICAVCGWEDDLVQLRWPTFAPGANRNSLVEAQLAVTGTPAASRYRRDPEWRPIDLRKDGFEPPEAVHTPWPEDRTSLYWWRSGYWRKASGDVNNRLPGGSTNE